MGQRVFRGLFVLALGGALVSCGLGKATRPDAPRGADALGSGNCAAPGEEGEPLVVDWKPERRADLEVAMKDGIAVVAYDCQNVKLLRDCTAPGMYGFTSIDKQEEVIQLEDEDEVAAELPGLLSMGAKLSAELERGTTIDIAFSMVGKKRTTLRQIKQGDLKGGSACKGATHFVRGANIGAFAMTAGSKSKAAAAAEIFGAGAKGSSSSSKIETTRAGTLGACEKASVDADRPPDQCGASIRLLLVAIDEKGAKDADDADLSRDRCPKGMALSGSKCVSLKKNVPRLCKPMDRADCEDQCGRGDLNSCVNLGILYEKGKGTPRDDKKAIAAYEKACSKGNQRGCSGLGVMIYFGYGVNADPAKAAKYFQDGCRAGEARACNGLGRAYHFGKGAAKNEEGAAVMYRKACGLGYALSCRHLGNAYNKGQGVPKDEVMAFQSYSRACQGNDARGCLQLAFFTRTGKGTSKDTAKADAMAKTAIAIIQQQCEANDSESCEVMADQYANGWSGVTKDESKALKLYEQACAGGQGDSCGEAAERYEKGTGTKKDPAKAKALRAQACKLDHEPSCSASVPGASPPSTGKKLPFGKKGK